MLTKRLILRLSTTFFIVLILTACQNFKSFTPSFASTNVFASGPAITFYIGEINTDKKEPGIIYLNPTPVLSRADLIQATVLKHYDSQSFISLQFTKSGADRLFKISQLYLGKRLAIVINGHLVAAPRLQEPLKEGKLIFKTRNEQSSVSIINAIHGMH